MFTVPFGVSLCWEVSEYYFVMPEGLGWTYYEFNVIITVANNSSASEVLGRQYVLGMGNKETRSAD